jgi:hypothetical protein
MAGRAIFEYDAEQNIIFTTDRWEIKTREDVDEFVREYEKFCSDLGKKAYMISDINNFVIHADVVDYYAEKAQSIMNQYLLGFARWGTNNLARMTVRTTSMKAKIAPNIYNTRKEAIQAIEEMKKTIEGE